MFSDTSQKMYAIKKLFGMDNNKRQAATYKPREMFFKFIAVLFSGDIARSLCTYLATMNNLKLITANAGRHKANRIIKYSPGEITTLFLEIVYITSVGMSNIASRVNSLRLVTDVR